MTVLMLLQGFYFSIVILLGIYGLNNFIMLALFLRRYDKKVLEHRAFWSKNKVVDWPTLTTQVPLYNEANVAERILDAVGAMEYRSGLHHIQVLDDSTDGTQQIVEAKVKAMQDLGHKIEIIRRCERTGYKAGALAYAHQYIHGDFLVLFDADFVPPKDFLKKTIPLMLLDSNRAFLQTRWGHLNKNTSWLTRAQALGMDGHFMVEQSARCFNGLFLNFNGTAGVWRKEAIEDVGGWSWDTLTEDMDLSYRVQLKGWSVEFVPEVIVPAELPEDIVAFKSQQFRWAKGSIQCAMKILPHIWAQHGLSFRSFEAWMHLTHYAIHPLMLLMALMSWPVLSDWQWSNTTLFFMLFTLIFSMVSTNMLYMVSQWKSGRWRLSHVGILPLLMLLGAGVAFNNSRAIWQALRKKKSEFVRTAKRGDVHKESYTHRISRGVIFELLMGIYGLSLFVYRAKDVHWVSPFVLIHALGFLWVGSLTLRGALSEKPSFYFLHSWFSGAKT